MSKKELTQEKLIEMLKEEVNTKGYADYEEFQSIAYYSFENFLDEYDQESYGCADEYFWCTIEVCQCMNDFYGTYIFDKYRFSNEEEFFEWLNAK